LNWFIQHIKNHGVYSKVALLFWIIFLFSCQNDMKKIKLIIDRQSLQVENAEEVSIIYSKEGYTKALLQTKRFTHHQQKTPTFIEMKEGLKVTFYDGDV
jgi:hypothetical protein